MLSQQFDDLPQIQYVDEARHNGWCSDGIGYSYVDKQPSAGFQVVGDDHGISSFGDGMFSMQPMQRFMYDQSPQTFGLLYANIPLQDRHQKQYVLQWPSADYHRTSSPDRTSVSGTSSYASPNELPSPHAYNSVPYGSPAETFQPSLTYHAGDHFTDFSVVSGSSGASISLKEIEYAHHEPEQTIEEADPVNAKYEPTTDSEHVAIKTERYGNVLSEYTESGMSNSAREAESVQPVEFKQESDEDSDYSPTHRGSKRRRSAPHATRAPKRRNGSRKDSVASTTSSNKPCRRSRSALKSNAGSQHQDDSRPFLCPLAAYNCKSTFASKNEWKRHVSTQHIKLGFWRCDLCAPTTDSHDSSVLYYNHFNRKDLFTQHLRRMHAAQGSGARHNKEHPVTEENIGEHQNRCYLILRSAPQQSICPFRGCDRDFAGPASWEERMEHVGSHLEKDRRSSAEIFDFTNWNVDTALEKYLMDEDLIVWENGTWKTSDGMSRRVSSDSSDDDY